MVVLIAYIVQLAKVLLYVDSSTEEWLMAEYMEYKHTNQSINVINQSWMGMSPYTAIMHR